MGEEQAGVVTEILRRWRRGDGRADDELMQALYPELRRLATRYLRGERREHTLQPTALVHEAYLRLAGGDTDYKNRVHFLAVAARVMRRVLVDHAKARRAQKRGGGLVPMALDEARLGRKGTAPEILALNESLERLAAIDERKGLAIELHFFGGLTYEETAETLEVSAATVSRELRFAKAWLASDLQESGS